MHWLAEYTSKDFVHHPAYIRIRLEDLDQAITILKTMPVVEMIDIDMDDPTKEELASREKVAERLEKLFPGCEVMFNIMTYS